MDEGRPSLMALETAVYRAVHQLVDRPPLLDDPLAVPILGTQLAEAVRADPVRFAGVSAARAAVVVRSCIAEMEIHAAAAQGVEQYVVFGAGLDTSGCRNPAGKRVRVFEIDHPATQAWKRHLLAEAGIAVPPWLTFVALDLVQDDVLERLRDAGFRDDKPAVVSMLGVVIYLPLAALQNLLGGLGALPAPTTLVFDYGITAEHLDAEQRQGREAAARVAARCGEPFVTFLDPGALGAELRDRGFRAVEDLDWQAMNSRWFAARDDGLRLARTGRRVLIARR